jgi:hypothetical protein
MNICAIIEKAVHGWVAENPISESSTLLIFSRHIELTHCVALRWGTLDTVFPPEQRVDQFYGMGVYTPEGIPFPV